MSVGNVDFSKSILTTPKGSLDTQLSLVAISKIQPLCQWVDTRVSNLLQFTREPRIKKNNRWAKSNWCHKEETDWTTSRLSYPSHTYTSNGYYKENCHDSICTTTRSSKCHNLSNFIWALLWWWWSFRCWLTKCIMWCLGYNPYNSFFKYK